jgi:hypothetical protein
MPIMTAEEAIEAAKGLTFEKVWASIERMGQRFEEMSAKTDEQFRQTTEQFREQSRKTDEQLREQSRKTEEQSRKTDAKLEETARLVDKVSRDINRAYRHASGIGNTLGSIVEKMFSGRIWVKFDAFGYQFTRGSNNVTYCGDDGKKLCEVDIFLENGEYVMAVEVKSNMETKDINKHLKRLDIVRDFMDRHNDKRKLLGAMAAGTYLPGTKEYAEENGLFVIVQDGESVVVSEKPEDFEPKVW